MHSIARSAAIHASLVGNTGATSSRLVVEGAKTPFAACHFSKKGVMSTARSLMIGKFSSGAISTEPFLATAEICVRQVHRGRPLTVIAQDPHMPTRQANRYDSVESTLRWTQVTTSSTVWLAYKGTWHDSNLP